MYKRISILFGFICLLLSCSPVATTTQNNTQEQSQTTSQKEKITLEDIWSTGKFQAESVWGMNTMNDGQSFSRIERGRYPSISTYDFRTGEKIRTVFDGAGHDLAFSSYQFSEDESKLLLATETEQIYRRSSKSQYYVFNTESGELVKLAEGSKQIYPAFSPDATKVAFVQDNDLHYKDLSTGEITEITTNGEWNYTINGMSDWVYEEEFSLTRAYEWSPNGEKIAFYSFDESEVKQFSMDMYGELYPQKYEFKYPKAGEKNSIVSTFIYSVATGESNEIETGKEEDVYFPRMKWTKGNELVLFKMNRTQNEIQLLKVNEENASAETFFVEENEYYISEAVLDEMEFLPNGNFLWTSERDGFKHVYLYGEDGRLIRQITEGNWEVTTRPEGGDAGDDSGAEQLRGNQPVDPELGATSASDGAGGVASSPNRNTPHNSTKL